MLEVVRAREGEMHDITSTPPPSSNNADADKRMWAWTLMAKAGWKEGQGLGANREGNTAPIKAEVKMDR
jgi:hypothetical protein